MNVLAVSDYLNNVGGAEISTREILVELAARDDVENVTVIGVEVADADRLEYPGVDVVSVSPRVAHRLPDYPADVVLGRSLGREVERRLPEADVVHAHHRRGSLAVAGLDSDVPSVGTVRDYWPICPISIYSVDGEQCTGCEDRLDDCVEYQGWTGAKGSLAKPYLLAKRRHNRREFGDLDCAVFIADHLRTTVGDSVSMPPHTEVIYNPVSVPDDLPDGEHDSSRLVTASSLHPEKGIETVVRAVSLLRSDDAEVTLDVFGDGPMRDDLESLAASLGVEDAVRFRGRRPLRQVYESMSTATATVFPSVWHEPFGRITVESMTLGTPVIGSAVGGIAEVVDDGRTGLLFPAGDERTLADRIARLLDDPELGRRLSAEAGRYAERFEVDAVARRHVDLYRRLQDDA